ncbi:MAG: protease pro-enzyme activation domain-containing protein, partial [Acidimicrobiales bacterium]
MRRPSPRAGAAALVVAIGLATVPVVGSASESSRVVVQRAAPLPAGASVLAPASATGFDVMLAIPHPGALSAFLADLSDPSSPSYRHFLTPAQFATRFGASLGAVAAVSSYLRGFGLDVGRLSAGHLALHVTGTTGQVARAFDARVVTLRHAGVTG